MDFVNRCVKWTCIGGASGIQISGGEPPPTRRRPEQNIKGFSSIFFFASKALLLQLFSSFVFLELFLLDRPFFSFSAFFLFFLSFFLLSYKPNILPPKKLVTTWGPLGDHIGTFSDHLVTTCWRPKHSNPHIAGPHGSPVLFVRQDPSGRECWGLHTENNVHSCLVIKRVD